VRRPSPRRAVTGAGSRFGHETATTGVLGLAEAAQPIFNHLNQDSSDTDDAYLSRIFAVNNDSPADPEPAAEPAPPLLAVRGVTVRFGGLTALEDVSFGAAQGQITGIIGPNGAGKTTLLNALCGFVRPQAGQFLLDGTVLGRVRPHRLAALGIARTLQGLGLFSHLSVLENVMAGAERQARAGFWAALGGLPRSDRDERALRAAALAALDRVGAADVADARPGQLPYGMRKRVALARALAGKPRLLLLDEPAGGLSEAELDELGGLISGLAGQTAMLLVEHRMDLVMAVCQAVVVLDFGRVIACGPPEQVQADPAVTTAYLGAGPGE
jgi:branched-chain amino acid transport system ATP-binding protein